jgi:hypothetical protein
MKQTNTLILGKITIALLNKQKTQYTPGGKLGLPPITERMYIDMSIPTSYTTPICAVAGIY